MARSERALVLLPAWNAGRALIDVATAVKRAGHAALIIDDGTTDGSVEALCGLPIEVINHDRNHGVGAAIRTGVRWAIDRGFSTVATIDADGQHDVGDLEVVVGALHGCDLAMGSRYYSGGTELPEAKVAAHLLSALVLEAVLAHVCVDAACGLRAFRPTEQIATLPFDSYDFLFEHHLSVVASGGKLAYPPVEAHYDPARLLTTRRSALQGFIRAVLRHAAPTSREARRVFAIVEATSDRRDFTYSHQGVELHGFYVQRDDGYLVQGEPDVVRKRLESLAAGQSNHHEMP